MFGEAEITAAMLTCIVEIEEDRSVPDKIRQLKYSALQELNRRVRAYDAGGCLPRLCVDVLKAKTAFLLKATTKREIAEILELPHPKYDGSKLVAGSPYDVPAEELIIWSETSLNAGCPLKECCTDRMFELMKECFGEEVYESIMGKTRKGYKNEETE